jgi:hypothetical protein
MVARGDSQAMRGALSPVQLDHLVRGYFSWLGTFAVGMADEAIRVVSDEPERPERDWLKFLSGNLASELDGAPSRYVTRMYEQGKVVKEAYGTWRQLQKEGRHEAAAAFREKNQETIGQYRAATRFETRMQKINARVREIERSAMPPALKRDAIHALRRQAGTLAKTVGGAVRGN